jgi:hypothetical protein
MMHIDHKGYLAESSSLARTGRYNFGNRDLHIEI